MKIYTKEIIKEKKSKNLRIKNIIKKLFTPILIIIIMLCIYVIYQKLVLKEKNIQIFGYKSYIVLTGSMEPTINPTDMVICKIPKSEDEIDKGDIITFYTENKQATVTHRVESVTNKNGEIYYKTKGDNNNSIDNELISYKNIQGIYCFKISKIGWILTKCFTSTGLIIIFMILALGYHNSSIKEDRRLTREEARKKYNICKYKKYEEDTHDTI